MSNQGDTTSRPLDVQQLKWAMRHGQKIEGLENIMISSQPVVLTDNRIDNMENNIKKESGTEGVSLNNAVLEEQIERLEKIMTQEIMALRSDFAMTVEGALVEKQIDKLGKNLMQEIVSLQDQVGMFVQAQLNQEKVWKKAEDEWKNALEDKEGKMQELIGKLLRQEVACLAAQLSEKQTRLIEDLDYIQHIVEDIATRPESIEAQQKLRENLFIREIGAVRREMTSMAKYINFKKYV